MRRHCLAPVLVLLAACSERPGDPAPVDLRIDEYAVWSAAVDARFGGRYATLILNDTTGADMARLPASLLDGLRIQFRREQLPMEMLDDYLARNDHDVRVDARRLSTRRVAVRPARGPGLGRAGAERLQLSRVGFDRSGRYAFVTVMVTCGGDCGNGARLLMERGADRRWRMARLVGFFYF